MRYQHIPAQARRRPVFQHRGVEGVKNLNRHGMRTTDNAGDELLQRVLGGSGVFGLSLTY